MTCYSGHCYFKYYHIFIYWIKSQNLLQLGYNKYKMLHFSSFLNLVLFFKTYWILAYMWTNAKNQWIFRNCTYPHSYQQVDKSPAPVLSKMFTLSASAIITVLISNQLYYLNGVIHSLCLASFTQNYVVRFIYDNVYNCIHFFVV